MTIGRETGAAEVVRLPRSDAWAAAIRGAGQAWMARYQRAELTAVWLEREPDRWISTVAIARQTDPRVLRDVQLGGAIAKMLLDGGGMTLPVTLYHEDLVVTLKDILGSIGCDAGPEVWAAVGLRYGVLFEGTTVTDDDDDSAQAVLADRLMRASGLALTRACVRLVDELGAAIDYSWAAVRALAQELGRRRYLTSTQVEAAIAAPGTALGQWTDVMRARVAMRLVFGVRDLVWALAGRSPCAPCPEAIDGVEAVLRVHPLAFTRQRGAQS